MATQGYKVKYFTVMEMMDENWKAEKDIRVAISNDVFSPLKISKIMATEIIGHSSLHLTHCRTVLGGVLNSPSDQ